VQQVAPLPGSAYGIWNGTPNTGVYGIGRWCRTGRVYHRGHPGNRRYRCSRPHRDGTILSVTFDLVR
jgi:hypothetical protein